jgi:hypothetical protein
MWGEHLPTGFTESSRTFSGIPLNFDTYFARLHQFALVPGWTQKAQHKCQKRGKATMTS